MCKARISGLDDREGNSRLGCRAPFICALIHLYSCCRCGLYRFVTFVVITTIILYVSGRQAGRQADVHTINRQIDGFVCLLNHLHLFCPNGSILWSRYFYFIFLPLYLLCNSSLNSLDASLPVNLLLPHESLAWLATGFTVSCFFICSLTKGLS